MNTITWYVTTIKDYAGREIIRYSVSLHELSDLIMAISESDGYTLVGVTTEQR